MSRRTIAHLTVLAGLWILILPGTAWAYIDPGTGSYLFQLVIAGGLNALYTLRPYWHTEAHRQDDAGGVLGRKRQSTAAPTMEWSRDNGSFAIRADSSFDGTAPLAVR